MNARVRLLLLACFLPLAALAADEPRPPSPAPSPAATAGWEAIRARDLPTARTRFQEATQADRKAIGNWQMLAAVERELGNHEAAATALSSLLRLDPAMREETERLVYALVAEAPVSPGMTALLEQLLALEWKPTDARVGSIWLRLAHERLQRGDRDGVRAALARLATPDDIVRVRSDKRFDGLYDPESPAFDAAAAAHRRVDDLRVQLILRSVRLATVADTLQASIAAGLFDAAEFLARRTESAVAAASAQAPFEDMHNLPWVMNLHSTALIRLDRADAGLEKLKQAASGGDVGRTLNLGNAYCDLGRGEEARAAVAGIDDSRASPVGLMVKQSVLHCAALLLHDRESAKQAMAYLAGHRDDSPDAYLWELMRIGRMDQAARSFIARLEAETTRGDALLLAQRFPDARRLPGEAAGYAKLKELLAREDVRRAIEKVGRVQAYDYNSY
jgi:tetratricopeptide (TPR) repeat protein